MAEGRRDWQESKLGDDLQVIMTTVGKDTQGGGEGLDKRMLGNCYNLWKTLHNVNRLSYFHFFYNSDFFFLQNSKLILVFWTFSFSCMAYKNTNWMTTEWPDALAVKHAFTVKYSDTLSHEYETWISKFPSFLKTRSQSPDANIQWRNSEWAAQSKEIKTKRLSLFSCV